MLIAVTHWMQGKRDEFNEHADHSAALLTDAPPSRSSAWVLARLATRASLMGDSAGAIELASKAGAVSEQLGWEEGLSEALDIVGLERVYRGDTAGIDDLKRAI